MTDAALSHDNEITAEGSFEASPPSSYPPSIQPGIPTLERHPNWMNREGFPNQRFGDS